MLSKEADVKRKSQSEETNNKQGLMTRKMRVEIFNVTFSLEDERTSINVHYEANEVIKQV